MHYNRGLLCFNNPADADSQWTDHCNLAKNRKRNNNQYRPVCIATAVMLVVRRSRHAGYMQCFPTQPGRSHPLYPHKTEVNTSRLISFLNKEEVKNTQRQQIANSAGSQAYLS